jgi:putative methylase
MSTRRALARQLGTVAGFEHPESSLEQYHTPAEIAAHLIHLADLQGDIDGHTVIDFGTGTGMLALGAALRGADHVLGIDIDREPLETARRNARHVGAPAAIDWVQGDVTDGPVSNSQQPSTTVVMNPPFGAQDGNEGADRAFLETTRAIASVSYSLHNSGSQSFVEAYAEDNEGRITHAFEAELQLEQQFDFHEQETVTIDAECFRIEWTSSTPS